MKNLVFLLIFLLCWASVSIADDSVIDKEVWDYSKVKNWNYTLTLDVVILMHEEFIVARDYYFEEGYKDREKVVAFTVWHRVDGKVKSIMFVQARINLEPKNNDLGHEMKHIINREHRRRFGVDRFPLPCDDWR
jgi:hypothetical protein